MKVFSKYLSKEVEVTSMDINSEKRELVLIDHDSLQDLFDDHQLEFGIKYILDGPKAVGNSIVYHCRMTDKSGRDVTEVGEVTPETLRTKIAQENPATIAKNRAFDNAVIRFFRLDAKKAEAKIYSAETQIQNDSANAENVASEKSKAPAEKPAAEPVKEEPTPAPAPAAPAPTPAPVAPAAIKSEELPVNFEEELPLDPAPAAEEPAPVVVEEVPAPKAEPAPAVSDPVLTFGKYKGKKVSEAIAAADKGWLEWVVNNIKGSNTERRALVEAAKKALGNPD